MLTLKFRVMVACLWLLVGLSGCDNSNVEDSKGHGGTQADSGLATEKTATDSAADVHAPSPHYTGGQACADCHADAVAQWKGSHHDLAMQPATATSVLGDFNNTTFIYNKIKSTFYRQQDQFRVRTDGPDGLLHDYTIKYTFGVEPLQQYLIEFEDGRVQALGIAWDSRSKEAGGQRWFHLYPDQAVDFKHRLHWTARDQNWNFMCAECHSTQLQKKYDPVAHRFNTSFSDINVACEACHGPGSNHVDWAKGTAAWAARAGADKGLAIRFDDRAGAHWTIDSQTGNAARNKPKITSKEINTCARCHSRRSVLNENFVHGRLIGNTHRVATLDQDLYFADGQPNDETFVYGSFLQSKMYHKGVTCSDCHQPHSLALKAPQDQVCYQCHQADKYASQKHHFHPPESTGASCIECHMPVTTFMVVDGRHDHSFRIPRPDLSVAINTPNSCNQCHQDKSAQWAADRVQAWYGHASTGFQQYAMVLDAARIGDPAVREALLQLTGNQEQPAIARATAAGLLPNYPGKQTATRLTELTLSNEPLIRRAAVEALSGIEAAARVRWLAPLLTDEVLDVRMAAVSALTDIQPQQLMPDVQARLQAALDEYIATQKLNADRPEAWVNLGGLYLSRNDSAAAINAYEAALQLDPDFVPALINLADLYRFSGQDEKGQALLEAAVQRNASDAALHHALGLLRVRQGDVQQGMKQLEQAAALAPETVRYAYVHAVALYSTGQIKPAIKLLETIVAQHPFERDSLWALVMYCQESGDSELSQRYRTRLQQLEPDNQQLTQ